MEKKLKKALLSGYYGFNNFGDEAILLSILNSFPQIDFTVLSLNPEKTMKEYNCKSIYRYDFKKIYKVLKSSDLLISGGGGLLQDATSRKSLMYYLFIIFLGIILKKKVIIYAQGVGPLYSKISLFFTKLILNKVDLITVRDEYSKNLLKKIGVKKKIYLTADPVFYLKIDVKNERKNLVGICLREWRELKKEIIAQVCDYLIKSLKKEVVFIPFKFPDDVKVCKEVLIIMKEKAELIEEDLKIEEIIKKVGECNLFISLRLHGLILAAISGIPFAGIVYDPKVRELLKNFNMPSLGEADNLNYEECIKIIEKLEREKEEIKESLKLKIKDIRYKAEENNKLVLENLF